jgi:hypothetical protein
VRISPNVDVARDVDWILAARQGRPNLTFCEHRYRDKDRDGDEGTGNVALYQGSFTDDEMSVGRDK